MGNKTRIDAKIPKLCREFVATNLILRSVGFKTNELTVSFTKNGKTTVDIDLNVHRKEAELKIELGSIKLPYKTVLDYWERWVATASQELVDDFSDTKTLFYSLNAYKTMELMLEKLQEQGFKVQDTNISETF